MGVSVNTGYGKIGLIQLAHAQVNHCDGVCLMSLNPSA